MLLAYNKAALSSAVSIPATATIVPVDTTLLNTNTNLSISNNAIQFSVPGYYETSCQVVLANSGTSAVTVTLTGYSDGTAISGATITQTIDAGETFTLYLPWIVSIKSATSGTATMSWYLSGGAVSLSVATITAKRHF